MTIQDAIFQLVQDGYTVKRKSTTIYSAKITRRNQSFSYMVYAQFSGIDGTAIGVVGGEKLLSDVKAFDLKNLPVAVV